LKTCPAKKESKIFFSEEKKQNTFILRPWPARGVARIAQARFGLRDSSPA
jgi:hypothetical protein